MPANYKIVANKKYMWDSCSYATENDALNAKAKYREHGFEVELFKEDGKNYLYTRRLAVTNKEQKKGAAISDQNQSRCS
ncbi:MAG: hypothetical protein HY811_11615 [Planctomycetes bacterium]|nr:hypothetical protein [Planctomycetota bacterium]